MHLSHVPRWWWVEVMCEHLRIDVAMEFTPVKYACVIMGVRRGVKLRGEDKSRQPGGGAAA